LNEIETEIKGCNCTHLWGFKKLCSRYNEGDIRKKYKTYGNPQKIICTECDKLDCKYRNQCDFLFEDDNEGKEIQVILAPLEYLYKHPLVHYVDQIFIDESIEKLEYSNIGVINESKLEMIGTIKRLGTRYDINTEIIIKQINNSVKIIEKIQHDILEKTSILKTKKDDILENFDSLSETDDYIIQKGRYITHPEYVKPILSSEIEDLIDNFDKNIEEYNDTLIEIIKVDEKNILISDYVNFPSQITAIKKLKQIYECKQKPFPININEKIEDRETVNENDIYFKKKDGTYLVSTIGKQYSTDMTKKLKSQPNSWITFGIHMMHTVFDIAKYKPVKLLDSSFNYLCFLKLYKENCWNDPDGLLPFWLLESKIVSNTKSCIYPILTKKNKYQSSFPKLVLITGDNKPTIKCWYYIKNISYFARQTKKEGKKTALITFKELKKYFIGPFDKKMLGHYHNIRGSNKKEDAEILINFGTPFHPPKTVLLDYISTFHEFPKDITPIKDTHGRFDGYKDKELNEFFEWHVMEEQYQAIHRSRFLLSPKSIILFGKIPKRIVVNKECTIKEPCTFNSVQSKLLDTKNYYLNHPQEARQELMLGTEKFDLNWFRKSIQDGTFFTIRAYELNLLLKDIWEIMLKSFKPIMNSILRCDWDNKKTLVKNVTKSVYKKSCIAKHKKRGLKRYGKNEIYSSIALLEKQGLIEIKEVSLNNIYHDTKRGEGYLIEFKK
jgi:hypothetical protein